MTTGVMSTTTGTWGRFRGRKGGREGRRDGGNFDDRRKSGEGGKGNIRSRDSYSSFLFLSDVSLHLRVALRV